VNKISIAVLSLLLVASASHADEISQWKDNKLSLRDLITNGYSVVAVTHETHAPGATTDTFFLYKSGSLCKCIEFHVTDSTTKQPVSLFTCMELVQPRIVPRSK
jgi:hypothetical protein